MMVALVLSQPVLLSCNTYPQASRYPDGLRIQDVASRTSSTGLYAALPAPTHAPSDVQGIFEASPCQEYPHTHFVRLTCCHAHQWAAPRQSHRGIHCPALVLVCTHNNVHLPGIDTPTSTDPSPSTFFETMFATKKGGAITELSQEQKKVRNEMVDIWRLMQRAIFRQKCHCQLCHSCFHHHCQYQCCLHCYNQSH